MSKKAQRWTKEFFFRGVIFLFISAVSFWSSFSWHPPHQMWKTEQIDKRLNSHLNLGSSHFLCWHWSLPVMANAHPCIQRACMELVLLYPNSISIHHGDLILDLMGSPGCPRKHTCCSEMKSLKVWLDHTEPSCVMEAAVCTYAHQDSIHT